MSATPERHFRFATSRPDRSVVEIDGHDIARHVHSLRLEAVAGDISKVELELHPWLLEYDIRARVGITPDLARVLVDLGCTAPEGQEVAAWTESTS